MVYLEVFNELKREGFSGTLSEYLAFCTHLLSPVIDSKVLINVYCTYKDRLEKWAKTFKEPILLACANFRYFYLFSPEFSNDTYSFIEAAEKNDELLYDSQEEKVIPAKELHNKKIYAVIAIDLPMLTLEHLEQTKEQK